MAGKVIEYKFTDWLGMSFDDSYEREEPQYKYITIDAPEDAKFAFKFREVLGDHRGYSTAFYCGNCNSEVTEQKDSFSCSNCGRYFIKVLEGGLRPYLGNNPSKFL